MSAINKQIRMCIICRKRDIQKSLNRFQLVDGKLVKFSKVGRSIYICRDCMCLNDKHLLKAINSKLRLKYKEKKDFGNFFLNCAEKQSKEIG